MVKVCPLMQPEPISDTGWEIVGPVTLDGVPQHSHVVPNCDTRRHQLDPTCWCEPEDIDLTGIYVHNSADGRERYEEGAVRPN